jgi:hypothetical protein
MRAGASWRMLPHDFPPWETVYQQTRRWLRAELSRGYLPRVSQRSCSPGVAAVRGPRSVLRGPPLRAIAPPVGDRVPRSQQDDGHRGGGA